MLSKTVGENGKRRSFGCYDSRKQAEKRLRQVHYFKTKGADMTTTATANSTIKYKGHAYRIVKAQSFEAHQLILFMENDAFLWQGETYSYNRKTYGNAISRSAVAANLVRKIANGTYDAAKAGKLWMTFATGVAKTYLAMFGGHMARKPIVKEVAQEAAKDFEISYEEGNFDEHIPKKYAKNFPGSRPPFPG